MKTLVIRELANFTDHLKRDVLVDLTNRPVVPPPFHQIMAILEYGQRYMTQMRKDPEHQGCVIWFTTSCTAGDDDDNAITMTWAHNPFSPEDPDSYGYDFFWRGSCNMPSDSHKLLVTADKAAEDFLAYTTRIR